MDLARRGEWLRVERLLLHKSISHAATNSAETLHARHAANHVVDALQSLVDVVVDMVENKLAFYDGTLLITWRLSCAESANKNPLTTRLWRSIEKTSADVMEKGDARDTQWLRGFLLPSGSRTSPERTAIWAMPPQSRA